MMHTAITIMTYGREIRRPRRGFGAGAAWYVATRLDEVTLARVLDPVLEAAGVEPGLAALQSPVDWALDIRDAVFADAAIRAVPGDLVLRDEDRHFLLDRADRDAVLSLPDAPPLARAYFRDFDLTPFDSMVAVASQGSKTYESQLAGLRWLRERGLAK